MKADLLSGVPALLAVLVLGCAPGSGLTGRVDADADPGAESDTAGEPSDAGPEPISVTSCSPDHGPFTGGQLVAVRGSGFGDGASVYFAEQLVPTEQTTVEDADLITVVTPANPPGPVEVRVVVDEMEAVKEDAYTYDVFHVDPPSGSIAGGTYVTIEGADTRFSPTSTVRFDGRDATDVTWISATRLACRTPPGVVGPADVEVAGDESYTVRSAYTYYNPVDPDGGLGGGPIDGSVNVSIIDFCTGEPVESALVMLGTEPGTSWLGLTGPLGQITFSGPGLDGPQTLTAAKKDPVHGMCEATTIAEFDARDVTILLWCRTCRGSHGPPLDGAIVRGELLFDHAGGDGPGPWEIVPEPGAGEEKIAYVYGTGWSIWYRPPDPTLGGVDNTVRDTERHAGEDGYVFACFVRPGTVAVYALAGLRDTVTDAFTPYAFGVARSIVATSGETMTGVRIDVDHQLDSTLGIVMLDPPPLTPGGPEEPDTYMVEVFIDLGAEGTIWRDDNSRKNHTGDTRFLFPAWLPMESELADATYTIKAGTYREFTDEFTGETDYINPFSVRIESGVADIRSDIVIGEFIGIPFQVDPKYAGVVTDRTMEFGHDGTAPGFWYVMLQTYPDQSPLWTLILPGHMTTYTLPDLTLIAGLPELPPGYSVWVIWGIDVPGLVYDEWSYEFLYVKNNCWSAYTADAFIFQFREE